MLIGGFEEQLLSDLENWAKGHNYVSISQFQRKLGEAKENTAAFAHVQYLKKTLIGE